MPIESESSENLRTKRLLNCNSFLIQLNDNGVKFYSVLPEVNEVKNLIGVVDFECKS